jgi:hypothetical protein
MKTEEDFFKAVGSKPVQDDMERVNCKRAGELGHEYCGWCDKHSSPKFHCEGCFLEREAKRKNLS